MQKSYRKGIEFRDMSLPRAADALGERALCGTGAALKLLHRGYRPDLGRLMATVYVEDRIRTGHAELYDGTDMQYAAQMLLSTAGSRNPVEEILEI